MLNAFFFETPIDSNYLGHQMAEVFKEKVYDRFFLGKKDLVVCDIGGNIGITSYYFSQFAKTVYTFEPSQEHFTVLTHMVEFNHLDHVLPFRLAVSNKDGDATFYHQGNKTMYSLTPPSVDPHQATEKVKTIRLDTFFIEQKIEHVDFMKMDVEGSEADIICGDAFHLVSPRIDTLFVEIHSWNSRHPNQLKDGLKAAGFTTIETIPNDAQLWIATK